MPGSSHPFTLHGQILAKTQAFFSIPRSFHLPLLHSHIPLVPAISCFSGKRLPLSHLTSCCPFLHSQRLAVCNNEFALLAFSSPCSPNSEYDPFGSFRPNHTFLRGRGTCFTISVFPVHQLLGSGALSPIGATGQEAEWVASARCRLLGTPLPWSEGVHAIFSLISLYREVLGAKYSLYLLRVALKGKQCHLQIVAETIN